MYFRCESGVLWYFKTILKKKKYCKLYRLKSFFVFQHEYFMVNFLDEYHNIHTKHVPTDLKKVKVAHMASSMVDIHSSIPAIKKNHVNPPCQITVTIRREEKCCLGGADVDAAFKYITKGLQDMKNHFTDQLPIEMKNLNPGNFHKLVTNLRYAKLLSKLRFTQT